MEKLNINLFGVALYQVRKRYDISQYELASRTGISEGYLNKIARGKREPGACMILRIGRALPCPPGDLINEMERLTREYELTGVLPEVPMERPTRRKSKSVPDSK